MLRPEVEPRYFDIQGHIDFVSQNSKAPPSSFCAQFGKKVTLHNKTFFNLLIV